MVFWSSFCVKSKSTETVSFISEINKFFSSSVWSIYRLILAWLLQCKRFAISLQCTRESMSSQYDTAKYWIWKQITIFIGLCKWLLDQWMETMCHDVTADPQIEVAWSFISALFSFVDSCCFGWMHLIHWSLLTITIYHYWYSDFSLFLFVATFLRPSTDLCLSHSRALNRSPCTSCCIALHYIGVLFALPEISECAMNVRFM